MKLKILKQTLICLLYGELGIAKLQDHASRLNEEKTFLLVFETINKTADFLSASFTDFDSSLYYSLCSYEQLMQKSSW